MTKPSGRVIEDVGEDPLGLFGEESIWSRRARERDRVTINLANRKRPVELIEDISASTPLLKAATAE